MADAAAPGEPVGGAADAVGGPGAAAFKLGQEYEEAVLGRGDMRMKRGKGIFKGAVREGLGRGLVQVVHGRSHCLD